MVEAVTKPGTAPWYYRPPSNLRSAIIVMTLWVGGFIVFALTANPWAFTLCALAIAYGIGVPLLAIHLIRRGDAG